MQLYFHGTLLLSGIAAATAVLDNTSDLINTMAQVETDDKDWVDVKGGESGMLAEAETDQLADSLATEVVQETRLG